MILDGSKEILKNEKDEDLREMAKKMELSELEAVIPALEEKLKLLLLPRDPLDDRNVIMEMRAGAGGDEASILFPTCLDSIKTTFVISVIKLNSTQCQKVIKGLKKLFLQLPVKKFTQN